MKLNVTGYLTLTPLFLTLALLGGCQHQGHVYLYAEGLDASELAELTDTLTQFGESVISMDAPDPGVVSSNTIVFPYLSRDPEREARLIETLEAAGISVTTILKGRNETNHSYTGDNVGVYIVVGPVN